MEIAFPLHAIVPSFTWTTSPRKVKSNKSWIQLAKPPYNYYQQGIIDEKYKPQKLIAESFEEAALWLSDEKHDGWLWPCATLVNSRVSKGNSNDKDPVKKWDADGRQAAGRKKKRTYSKI